MIRFLLLPLLLFATALSAQSIQWITACSDQSFCLPANNCTQGNAMLVEKAVTNCSNHNLSYSYKIDLFNDGSLDISSGEDTLSGLFPKGIHRVTWRVTDNCGHASTCAYNFTIKDCSPPALLCINGLTQTLDEPNCSVSFSPGLFVVNATDNCTASNQIQFGIREMGTGTGFPATSEVSFDRCDKGVHTLEVWAKDVNGLTNHCNTYVLVQQGVPGSCTCITDADVMLAGCVHTPANKRLSDYRVQATLESTDSLTTPFTKSVSAYITDSCFSLLASTLPLNDTYRATLRASRYGNPLNGVSTFDLVQISQHILSLAPFTSIYQAVAADLNNSHSVTTSDIVVARKVILGINDSFPGVPSWRLIRPVANPANLGGLAAIQDTYQLNVPALTANFTLPNVDFIAIKMGDVNQSVQALGGPIESRGAPVLLGVEDQFLEAGVEITVPVRLQAAASWLGWQLALRGDPGVVRITGVTGLTEENYAQAWDGSLRALWFGQQLQHFAKDDILFTLTIKALQPTWLSQALTLQTDQMAPEAYPDMHDRRPLDLQIQRRSANGTVFFAPQPNPFAASTNWRFQLDQPAEAVLELFDETGKRVYSQSMAAVAGMNNLVVPADALPRAGLYAFRLHVGNQIQSGRLVRM